MTSVIQVTKSKLLPPKNKTQSIYWFRKCLRLHDNPALLYALENSDKVYPIFILDPWFVQNAKVGPNRWRFLLETLNDLNDNLMKRNSRLLLIQGPVVQSLTEKINEWKINLLCFESDTEPYAKQRDKQVMSLADSLNVHVVTKCSHTLYDPNYLFAKNGNKVVGAYTAFQSLAAKIGDPMKPLPEPTQKFTDIDIDNKLYKVPDLHSIGVDESKCGPNLFPGGETQALKRFHKKFENEAWISAFEKPSTSPNSLEPSTTVLSPYLKFGCISVRLFYHSLKDVYRKRKNHSKPPVSLEGQLLFREYFYFMGAHTENFNKMKGNSNCRQIAWDENEDYFNAWREAKTGFPWIDAIMTQLRQEGWIHHLARHAVACFLTRGHLYQSWEKGQGVFEEYLLDADWSLNAANWQWLSASAFYSQYWKCYSPIEFGKKTDKNGDFIRKYLPVFKNFPSQYIYEPWNAPPSVQRSANCVIGVDYPKPIIDSKVKGKICMERMKKAYAAIKEEKEAEASNAKASKAAAPKKVTKNEESKSPKKEPKSAKNEPKSVKNEPKITNFVKSEKRPASIKKELNQSISDEDIKPTKVEAIKARVEKLKKVAVASKDENQSVPERILKKNFSELETIKHEIEDIQKKSGYNLRNLRNIKYKY